MLTRPTLTVLLAAIAIQMTQAQSTRSTKNAVAEAVVYYSPEQEDTAIRALASWSIENSSSDRPAATRQEYGDRVLEIIKHSRPRLISYEMYNELHTDGQYLDGRGDALFDAWLTMRSLPQEIGRTSLAGSEVVTYRWVCLIRFGGRFSYAA